MPEIATPIIEIDQERRVVRREGQEVSFARRELEWNTFVKLFEAAKHGQSCTVASLAACMSAVMFFSALSWLKSSLKPLDLDVVQFDGPTINFQLIDMLTLEEVAP
jgi:hypothetical protein